jgi:hypothetical protein
MNTQLDTILVQVGEVLAESAANGQRKGVEINQKWLCRGKTGHVLGVSVRVRVETEKRTYYVDRLLKFRQAVDPAADQPAEIEVDCEVEGTAYDIRCTVCGATRTWWMGEAALERFVEKARGGEHGNDSNSRE